MDDHLSTGLPIENGSHGGAAGACARSVGWPHASLPECNLNFPFVQYADEFDIRPVRESRMTFKPRADAFYSFVIELGHEQGAVRIPGGACGDAHLFGTGAQRAIDDAVSRAFGNKRGLLRAPTA